MPSSRGIEHFSAYPAVSALIARSEINIRRSRALVASADALVRATRRIRRPRFAGGSGVLEKDPRALRTWTRVKNGGLPTTGVRRRWVGPGRGGRCDGCSDGIGPHETEFEVDFGDALVLRFHRDCFKTWQSFDGERR